MCHPLYVWVFLKHTMILYGRHPRYCRSFGLSKTRENNLLNRHVTGLRRSYSTKILMPLSTGPNNFTICFSIKNSFSSHEEYIYVSHGYQNQERLTK